MSDSETSVSLQLSRNINISSYIIYIYIYDRTKFRHLVSLHTLKMQAFISKSWGRTSSLRYRNTHFQNSEQIGGEVEGLVRTAGAYLNISCGNGHEGRMF